MCEFCGRNRIKEKCSHRNCQNKNDNAASSTGSQLSFDSAIVEVTSAAGGVESTVNRHALVSQNSTTFVSLFSGVDFSTLAAVSQQIRSNISVASAQSTLTPVQNIEQLGAATKLNKDISFSFATSSVNSTSKYISDVLTALNEC